MASPTVRGCAHQAYRTMASKLSNRIFHRRGKSFKISSKIVQRVISFRNIKWRTKRDPLELLYIRAGTRPSCATWISEVVLTLFHPAQVFAVFFYLRLWSQGWQTSSARDMKWTALSKTNRLHGNDASCCVSIYQHTSSRHLVFWCPGYVEPSTRIQPRHFLPNPTLHYRNHLYSNRKALVGLRVFLLCNPPCYRAMIR